MYYFDNEFLQQYLDTGTKLKVYVDSEWYDIPEKSDVSDKVDGIGYTQYGQPHYFDYRDVEQIKAGNKVFTLDMLQSMQGGKPADAGDKKKKGSSEEGGEEQPEPGGDEGFGDLTSGAPTDISSLVGGGGEPAAGGEPSEGGEQEAPTEEEPEGEKQPQNAGYQPYEIGRMIIKEWRRRKK